MRKHPPETGANEGADQAIALIRKHRRTWLAAQERTRKSARKSRTSTVL